MTDIGSETHVLARQFQSWDEAREPETTAEVVTTAEISECNCPDFCERDHELD
jgi:hypothetical protein